MSDAWRFVNNRAVPVVAPSPRRTGGSRENRASARNAKEKLSSEHPARIALFVPTLEGGGAELVMVTLANALVERGFAVDFVLWAEGGPFRGLLSAKVNVVVLGTYNPLKLVFGFARFLKTYKPEVVISALFVGNIIAALAKAASRSRTHLILTEHVPIGTYLQNESRLLRRVCVPPLMRSTYLAAQDIVAVSRGAAQALAPVLGKAASRRITVIYNPIDLARIEAMASADEKSVSWTEPTIINVGRLAEQKDQQTLIQAFAKVRSRRTCRLVILGEGEKRATLAALARKLGVGSDVSMPGFVANPYSWMRRSTVFVLSSKFEGLPTVLIEAMQCGVPVISADCPSGPAEILEDGRWGRLFQPGDVDALASAIEDALDGKLVADVRQRAADFSVDVAVSRYVALFPDDRDRNERRAVAARSSEHAR
jgi:glycosyltransferase involved in cell wall biosynthesis